MEKLGKGVKLLGEARQGFKLLLEAWSKGFKLLGEARIRVQMVQASLGSLEGFKLLGEACSKVSKGSSFPKKLKPRVQKVQASTRS